MHARTAFLKMLRSLFAVMLALAFVAGLMVPPAPAVAALPPASPRADAPTFHWVATWGAPAAPGELNAPADIAVDAAGNIYIADTGNHRIQVFTSDGVFLRTFGRLGRGDGEFYNPQGIAVRGDRVYVADTNNSRVQVFTLAGDFVRQIGHWADRDPDSLPDPVGVDADAAGRIYVLSLTSSYAGSQRNQRLSRFAPDGAPEGFRENGCATGALAVDSTGIAYCSPDIWGVTRISPSWESQQIATNSGQPGFLHRPRALASAPDVSLWVYELDDSLIKHFDSQGAFLSSFALPSGVIALVATGDRLLVLTDAPQVVTYDWFGNRLNAWGTAAFAAPGSFDHPDHLAAAPDGTFYVLEQSRGRIQHLDGNGQLLAVIEAGQIRQGNLYKPEALTVDALGRLLVLDPKTVGSDSQIARFVADQFETTFDAGFAYYPNPTNSMGLFSNLVAAGDTLLVMSAVGQVERADLDGVRINEWFFGQWPTNKFSDLTVGASGRVYGVNPLDLPPVKAATLVGTDQFTWGGSWLTDPFSVTCVMPSAIAADLRGRVFVLDTDNRSMPLFAPIFSSRMQVFDESGAYLASWGSFGQDAGQFANAQAIAALPDGRIVVADTGNNRLQVFAPDAPLPPYTPLPGPTRYDTPLPPLAVTWEDHGPAGGSVYGLIGTGLGSDTSLWVLVSHGLLAVNPSDNASTWLLDFSSYYASERPLGRSALAASLAFAQDETAVAYDSITTDGGQSWQALSFAIELRDVRTSATAFAPDFARSHIIAIAWSPSDSRGSQGGPFALSADGGQTWQRWWHPVSAPVAVIFDAAWPTNATLYLGGESGLAASTNLGQTWQMIGDPVGRLNVTGLVSRSEGNQSVLYAATSTHGVWRSADSGQTWVAFNAGLPNGHTCRLANAADLLAVGLCDGGLYLWQNALASWQRLGDPAPGGINALLLQRERADGIVWAGTGSGLYRMTFPAAELTPRLRFPLLLAR